MEISELFVNYAQHKMAEYEDNLQKIADYVEKNNGVLFYNRFMETLHGLCKEAGTDLKSLVSAGIKKKTMKPNWGTGQSGFSMNTGIEQRKATQRQRNRPVQNIFRTSSSGQKTVTTDAGNTLVSAGKKPDLSKSAFFGAALHNYYLGKIK